MNKKIYTRILHTATTQGGYFFFGSETKFQHAYLKELRNTTEKQSHVFRSPFDFLFSLSTTSFFPPSLDKNLQQHLSLRVFPLIFYIIGQSE